jgi:TPR repeat protein
MKHLSRLAALLLMFVLAAPVAADPWDDAWAIYQRGDFAEAMARMTALAEAGNVEAMDRLSHMYWFGEGTSIDHATALEWSSRSAALGSRKGMNDLGAHYEQGYGVVRDVEEAIRWYRKAAAMPEDDGWSDRNIADLFAAGDGVEKDEAEALRLYRIAVAKGDPGAHFQLANAYLFGELGLTQDADEALRLLQIAANKNAAAAQWQLAMMYATGSIVDRPDPVLAVKWYQLSIQRGCQSPLPEAITANLTRGDITTGFELAAQWLKNHPPKDVHPHPAPTISDCGKPLDPLSVAPSTDAGV